MCWKAFNARTVIPVYVLILCGCDVAGFQLSGWGDSLAFPHFRTKPTYDCQYPMCYSFVFERSVLVTADDKSTNKTVFCFSGFSLYEFWFIFSRPTLDILEDRDSSTKPSYVRTYWADSPLEVEDLSKRVSASYFEIVMRRLFRYKWDLHVERVYEFKAFASSCLLVHIDSNFTAEFRVHVFGWDYLLLFWMGISLFLAAWFIAEITMGHYMIGGCLFAVVSVFLPAYGYSYKLKPRYPAHIANIRMFSASLATLLIVGLILLLIPGMTLIYVYLGVIWVVGVCYCYIWHVVKDERSINVMCYVIKVASSICIFTGCRLTELSVTVLTILWTMQLYVSYVSFQGRRKAEELKRSREQREKLEKEQRLEKQRKSENAQNETKKKAALESKRMMLQADGGTRRLENKFILCEDKSDVVASLCNGGESLSAVSAWRPRDFGQSMDEAFLAFISNFNTETTSQTDADEITKRTKHLQELLRYAKVCRLNKVIHMHNEALRQIEMGYRAMGDDIDDIFDDIMNV